MRYTKFLAAMLLVLITTTAGAAPRDDDPRGRETRNVIQRVITFIKHLVVPTDDGKIGVPIP
jgi:hypothetical protein